MVGTNRPRTVHGQSLLAVVTVAFLLWLCLPAGAQQGFPEPLPVLCVDLATENRGNGLSVPSDGDGINRPVKRAGSWARQTDTKRPSYLYVRIDAPAYTADPRDLYVTVDLYDDGFRWLQLQYDKVAPDPNLGSKYTKTPSSALLTGSRTWITRHFFLPDMRMGHGQNHGADFRLCGSGLIVRRVEVRAEAPAGFAETAGVAPEALAQLRVPQRPEMELTFGNDAGTGEAMVLAAIGVTSVESYVDWAGVETEEGSWDWSKWDRQVEVLERTGLKWVPFLLVGMPYATPMWFQESEKSAYYACLEHGKENRTQTLFNPHLPNAVDRYLSEFAKRYRDRGVIESVLLGITGIYGESIYPAGPDGGGWTARLNGPYHNHMGWWAGDPLAGASFRKAVQQRYTTIAALNTAWGTDHASFAAVKTFLPKNAPNDRARADMAQWYQQSMTDWAGLWVRLTRRHFPNTEIYLCTGGRGTPELGADFSAQAKAIAPYGAGIRITNEASDYAGNFVITRETSTATRFYGTFCGFEPAGRVDPKGVLARLYNATASGARQLHFYHPNVLAGQDALDAFRTNVHHLLKQTPIIPVAFYVSRETWEVDLAVNRAMYDHARMLRDVTDFEMVTRDTVTDGILEHCRALVLVESPVLEPAVADRIEAWVKGGGILLVAGDTSGPVGDRLHKLAAWRERLLPPQGKAIELTCRLAGEAPDSWQLLVGTQNDTTWLYGDWFSPERGLEWPDRPDARKRWSGARPGIRLPVRAGADYTLRIDAHLSGHSVGKQDNAVSVNGTRVGCLDRAGSHVYTFTVPRTALGPGDLAKLEITVRTWRPSEHGSGDGRDLGVALHRLDWTRAGANADAPGQATLVPALPQDALSALTRRVGNGLTVNLYGQGKPDRVAIVAAEVLRHTPNFLPGATPVVTLDGRPDGRYVSVTDRGVLWYDRENGILHEQRQ